MYVNVALGLHMLMYCTVENVALEFIEITQLFPGEVVLIYVVLGGRVLLNIKREKERER